MIANDFLHLFGAFAAAFVAGGINSAAGGGTMLSFPVLLALGLSPLTANATNTAGIWSGSLGSVWGFRAELRRIPKRMFALLIPSLIGSAAGALLLRFTAPAIFERIVPWLLLFATLLFIIQAPVRERLRRRRVAREAAAAVGQPMASTPTNPGRSFLPAGLATLLQIAVAIYGGYFGAGMSILMLTALSIMGMTDMLEMTAMTSVLALAINGIAAVLFAFGGLIYWPYAAVMAVGSILGGYGAAGLARKVGKVWIRRLVIAVGLVMAGVLFFRLAN